MTKYRLSHNISLILIISLGTTGAITENTFILTCCVLSAIIHIIWIQDTVAGQAPLYCYELNDDMLSKFVIQVKERAAKIDERFLSNEAANCIIQDSIHYIKTRD